MLVPGSYFFLGDLYLSDAMTLWSLSNSDNRRAKRRKDETKCQAQSFLAENERSRIGQIFMTARSYLCHVECEEILPSSSSNAGYLKWKKELKEIHQISKESMNEVHYNYRKSKTRTLASEFATVKNAGNYRN